MRGLGGIMIIGLLASGCVTQEQDHIGEAVGGIHSFAMTETTTPFFQSMDGATLFLLETRIEYPITPPTAEEMAELLAQPTGTLPRMPWVLRDDLLVEVDLSVTNLHDDSREVVITLNGFNEFFEYQPGFTVDDEDVIPDFAAYERALLLEPFETRQLTIREDELDEVAVDLATIGNGAPNANLVVFFENHSSTDERVQPYIPEVIAGLTGFRLGLRAFSASNIVVEATVRIRDMNDRLYDGDYDDPTDQPWLLPVPAIIMPNTMYMP